MFLKGEALALDETTLPAAGSVDGEIRFSNADQTIRRWNAALAAWVLIGGGTSGVPIEWYASAGHAPLLTEEYGANVIRFPIIPDSNQYMTTWVKVPKGFEPRSTIDLKLSGYSEDTANGYTVRATANLVRGGVDAVDSLANARQTDVTWVNGSPAHVHTTLTIQLTDNAGQINGILPSEGDLIQVRLALPNLTSVQPLSIIAASEITF